MCMDFAVVVVVIVVVNVHGCCYFVVVFLTVSLYNMFYNKLTVCGK